MNVAPRHLIQKPLAPTDALTSAFVQLVRLENTNTNQIVVVRGILDAQRLSAAVRRAAKSFPLLRARHSADPGARPPPDWTPLGVSIHDWDGRCDLHDAAFRDMLMTLSRSNRLDWLRRPPIQVYLVLARDGQSSCVYLTSAHAVADARSDCLLLARIMEEFAATEGAAERSQVSKEEHGFETLQAILPAWYTPHARLRRLVSAGCSIARDILRSDQRLVCKRAPDIPHSDIDFFQSLVDAETAAAIRYASRYAGVTINTLFLAALIRLVERGGTRPMTRVTCALSLRNSLDAAYDQSFRNYLLPITVRAPRGMTDADLVSHVHEAMDAARRQKALQRELGRLECMTQSVAMPVLDPLTRIVIERAQGTNACLSNPGVIREDLSGFGPAHPTLQYVGFGCLLEPYDFVLYPPTVNGRLQLDVVYRRAAFRDIRKELVEPYRKELLGLLRSVSAAFTAAANTI